MYRRLGSIPAVAAELGVPYETARRWLQAADVPVRAKGRPSPTAAHLETPALVRRYERGESIAAIGSDLGVSPTTVRKRLLEASVHLRPRPGWRY